MNGIEKRLLTACLLALTLHGALLFRQLNQGHVVLPKPLPVQRIAVSLGGMKVAKKQAAVPKEVQQPQKEKEDLTPGKVEKKSSPLEPVIFPKSKPQPPARKIVHEKSLAEAKPEVQRIVPVHEEQSSVMQLPVLKTISQEDQLAPEIKAPSQQADADIESEKPRKAPAAAHVVRKATPLYQVNPPPKYPRLARRRGLEGVVLLEALVDISGRVAELRLFTSSGHSVLDKSALKAVRHWRFTPGTIADRRQEMWVKVPVRFELK